MEKIKDVKRQIRQIEELTDKMRKCKSLRSQQLEHIIFTTLQDGTSVSQGSLNKFNGEHALREDKENSPRHIGYKVSTVDYCTHGNTNC